MGRAKEGACEWARRVGAWRRSGESAAEYAERHGWNPRTLTWWASELRRRAVGRLAGSSTPSFVEVVTRDEPSVRATSPLELILPGVGTVRVSAGYPLRQSGT
jgi:transposase